ncbi:MAG: nuclear transport factor 2 family protein [Proteobacteria bacterium]|nr:nuclear transport factor 2 family protein [Pseudomonadota bacterium]
MNDHLARCKPAMLGLVLTAVAAAAATTAAAAPPAKARRIADGERAAATIAVQNLMSRHEYMHAAGRNLEELDSMWVARDGRFAATATFGSPAWVMYGLETIRNAYGLKSRQDAKEALTKLAAIDRTVKDDEASFGAGAEWVMHTSTTPVIEVADDGQTAQGAWYSPGVGVMPFYVDGKIHLQSMFFFEKYGADFVKENGRWKIWHLQMAYDFVPNVPESMLSQLNDRLGELAFKGKFASQGGEAGERAGFPAGFRKPLYSYPAYSPQRPAVIWPKLPQPYRTFKETFNNCNCEQTLP